MLTKEQKKQLVQDLSKDIKASKSVVFVDYRGIKVKDLTELKKELRASDVKFKVAKKTLIEKAFKDSGIEADVKGMNGQVALVLSADEITGAKIIDKFGKTNENLKVLAGVLNNKIIDVAEIKNLARLPGKEELLAKLIGAVNAPISGLVNVLAGNIRGLVQVLRAVSENKS